MLKGGSENDFVYGGKANDSMYGLGGDDTLDGQWGHADAAWGGDGTDTCIAESVSRPLTMSCAVGAGGQRFEESGP